MPRGDCVRRLRLVKVDQSHRIARHKSLCQILRKTQIIFVIHLGVQHSKLKRFHTNFLSSRRRITSHVLLHELDHMLGICSDRHRMTLLHFWRNSHMHLWTLYHWVKMDNTEERVIEITCIFELFINETYHWVSLKSSIQICMIMTSGSCAVFIAAFAYPCILLPSSPIHTKSSLSSPYMSHSL